MTTAAPRCPGGDWTYDPQAACVMARRPGADFPLLWIVGRGIVEPDGQDAPNPPAAALALHILQDHPNSETARTVNEWETYAPLRELNAALTQLASRPWWRRLF